MARPKRKAIWGRWILSGFEENKPQIIENHFIVIDGAKITEITPKRPEHAEDTIEITQAFVVPGFFNLHNHCFSAPLFRGLTEDLQEEAFGGNIIYSLLMPMGALAVETLSEDELRAVGQMAVLDLLRNGTTTVLDIWRPNQSVFLDVAKEMGIRAYGCPYLFSTPDLGISANGLPTYGVRPGADSGLSRTIELFQQYDEGPNGRIRVGFAPHGVDTCKPELLHAVRKGASELGCPITIHLAQSKPEIDLIRERYDKSPIEHLRDLRFLVPQVLVAHCVYATDTDLQILRDSGATLVTCPQTFARSGTAARFDRFRASGVRVTIGTDGYAMDIITELRVTGIIAKIGRGTASVATASELIAAVTSVSAAALRRSDLGVISPRATADLVIIDMSKPHLQPVMDPLRTLVWSGSGTDVSAVLVDGEILIREGKYTRADEEPIIVEAAKAVEKVWRKAVGVGLLKPGLLEGGFRNI